MVAIKLQNFGGMVPAVDPHLLPQSSAEFAENAWVYNGSVQGFKRLRKVHTPVNPAAQKAFRIPIGFRDSERIPDSFWLEFISANTDVVRSPASGDQFDRFYWASDIERPYYNTRQRIVDGDPKLKLGVPAPTVAPVIDAFGGGNPVETRAYVYTWVTAFGEEGPPSPPTLSTANTDGTWNITLTAPSAADTGERLLEKVRVYRTVSGVSGETDYFFVGEQDIALTAFEDDQVTVTGNRLIESLFWTEPPEDLQGFVAMPNGIIASWRANEIWFCEPFRPHAWPSPYQISVDAPVVGCGVIGQTLIVCTEGAPYAITGVNPASMAQSRLATFEPCTTRGSIVSTPAGVGYASPNGLVLTTAAGAQVITRQMMQKEDWARLLYLPTAFATTFNGGYYAFGSTAIGCFNGDAFNTEAFLDQDLTGAFTGIFVDPNDPRIAVTTLRQPVAIRNVYSDIWTGEVFVHRDDGIFWLDQTRACTEPRQPYIWRSKRLETPARKNFEAMRVYFSLHRCSPTGNEDRISPSFIDPWDDSAFWSDEAEWEGKDLVLDENALAIIRVYGDGVLQFARELRSSGEFIRLPSGFKATFWQIELESRVQLESVEVATTARELGSV